MKKNTKNRQSKKRTAPKAAAKRKPAKHAVVKPAPAGLSSERLGILGGAFNPVHAGHLNAALTVLGKLKLDRVLFVPALNPPHREVAGASAEDRMLMVRAAVKTYEPELAVSDMELVRGGTSYTYDTLKELQKSHKPENLYFIMGADAFADFPGWKNFEELLGMANFVVTSRPGTVFGDLPEALEVFVKAKSASKTELKTGKTIYRVELEDIDISSTELRKRLRNGQSVQKWIPPKALEVINEKSLYKRSSPLVSDYRAFAVYCAQRALDKKGLDLKVYDMVAKNSYADYSVICSATSSRHATSVAEGILEAVKDQYGLTPISTEGLREGLWTLLDFGAVVVHVFQDAVRQKYHIEDLWKDCPQIQREADPRLAGAERPVATEAH